ncbi:SusC/RagA family TonB-linked outer membrane protein [Parapedobacter defluvii]|nr:TonB-dependent receptor [Parapedobacter defluvii]
MKKSSRGKTIAFFLRQLSSKRTLLMRTFLILIATFSTVFQLLSASPAHAQHLKKNKVSFSVVNQPLGQTIKQLAQLSGLSFTYNEEQLNQFRVSVSSRSESVERVLVKLLSGLPLVYKEVNGKVVVYASRQYNATLAQEKIEVKGSVMDSLGNPMQGVSVAVEDHPTAGTYTDANGMYIVQVPAASATLVFSMVGYQKQTIQVTQSRDLDIVLAPGAADLDEVVVVGYGVQKKASVIGAISTVSKDLLLAPVSKVSSSLAGKLSGVIAIQRSGEPGAGSTFWIRGVSTLGTANPLVLVDGIERDIDLVDPEDIQEFSILKDAAATAVYGVRGANGVVLITTRSGKIGQPQISVKAEQGFLSPTNIPEMANSVQFAEMYNAASGFDYFPAAAVEAYRTGSDPDLYPNVDWINELYKNYSNNNRVNLNVSGGSNTVNYYVSGGYYGENGLFKADNLKAYNTSNFYRAYNFRSNVDVQIFKYTKLNINLTTKFERKNDPGSASGTIWDYALKTTPNSFPMVYSNGLFPGPGDMQGYNPYALLTQTGYREAFWNNAQSLFGITQDLGEYVTKGLSLNLKASFDALNYSAHNRTRTAEQWIATGRDENGELEMVRRVEGQQTLNYSETRTGTRRFYLEASANYARSFGEHNLGGLLLYQQSQRNEVGVATSQLALPYKNQGIAARLTYDYANRYFIEGNFGYNGSENFSPGKRFGFFPSIALGWMISNEPFFSPLTDVVSMFKLRGSLGTVGNNEIGGNRRFIYLETINSGNSGIGFGEGAGAQPTYAVGDWANDNVSWEKARKLNVGVDLSFFNALNLQADYFRENRTGIFLQRGTIPSYVGISTTPYVNIGEMRNSGVDLSLRYNQTLGEVFLSGLANYTFARNIVLNQDQPEYDDPYLYSTGQARWQQFGYIAAGLFQNQEEIDAWPVQNVGGQVQPGDIKYLDLNGDGVVNTFDRKAIGYTNVPEVVYGFGLSARWKAFDASLFFQGNGNVNFLFQSDLTNPITARNMNESGIFADVVDNYWTPENPDAKYPRLTTAPNPNNNVASSFWMADGSYLRLKNAELGYLLPERLMQKARIKGLRIYVSGVNLLTFANFKLWDPDLQTGATTFPPNRIFNIGLNMSL